MEISIQVSEKLRISIFQAEVCKMRRKCYGYKKGMIRTGSEIKAKETGGHARAKMSLACTT